MADELDNLGPDDVKPIDAGAPAWSQVWQMPALILGVALFTVGLALTMLDRQGPNYSARLDDAADYLKAGNLEKAQETLDRLSTSIAQASEAAQGRYDLLWGDLVFVTQRDKGWHERANDEQVITRYRSAMEKHIAFDEEHLQRWAQALVALDRFDDALTMLEQIKAGGAQRRYLVIRQMIERRLAGGRVTPDIIEPLRQRFLEELNHEQDESTRRRQQIWAAAVRARTQLDANQPDLLIDFLVVAQIPRLVNQGGDEDLAPLYVLLGQAYQRIGSLDTAKRYYILGEQKTRDTDDHAGELRAAVLTGLGQIAMLTSHSAASPETALGVALDLFSRADLEYPATAAHWEALLGRADCEARLGMKREAMEHYGQAARQVAEASGPLPQQQDQLIDMIRQRAQVHVDRSEYDVALAYLERLSPLFKKEWPDDLLRRLAETHMALAMHLLDQAAAAEKQADASFNATRTAANVVPSDAQPTLAVGDKGAAALPTLSAGQRLRMDAGSHFAAAGDLFIRLADALTITEPAEYAAALWKAADAYDRNRQWRNSIEALGRMVKSVPADPRAVEAKHRLGMSYMADGQYSTAADIFKDLIVGDNAQSPSAYASYVPLARCQVLLNQVDDAKRVLRNVVNNNKALTPESPEFRDALVELGRLHYRQKEFEDAIVRLSEAVQRYGMTPQAPTLRFHLADAYRQSIANIQATLGKEMPDASRQELEQERNRRLDQAQVLYSQVISELESRRPESLTRIEKLYWRNSYFYRADCAYDLGRHGAPGRFEQAIALYDMAARRFDDQPASLIALVQMVNAYCELNRIQEARAVNQRARQQLKRLPADAFSDPDLPMSREHWESWLRFTSEHNLFDSQANAGANVGP
ncbi:MAG: tetratricopeptide repeat protein [Phycisphaeraceae bacterium]